jgi:hypothetical protein
MMVDNLAATKGDVSQALHLYNAGKLATPSATTDWGPQIGSLPYENSAMRYLGEIQSQTTKSWEHDTGLGR